MRRVSANRKGIEMIRVDTNRLLDKCHCGAHAGYENEDSGKRLRAGCPDCCERTEFHADRSDAMIEWNLARRAEKVKARK